MCFLTTHYRSFRGSKSVWTTSLRQLGKTDLMFACGCVQKSIIVILYAHVCAFIVHALNAVPTENCLIRKLKQPSANQFTRYLTPGLCVLMHTNSRNCCTWSVYKKVCPPKKWHIPQPRLVAINLLKRVLQIWFDWLGLDGTEMSTLAEQNKITFIWSIKRCVQQEDKVITLILLPGNYTHL